MKKFFLILIVGSLVVACNPEKQRALHKVKYLCSKIDSISDVYNSIDFNEFKDIKNEISTNGDFLKDNAELIEKIDSNFISYFGPYLAAGKTIGRGFKKVGKNIETELAFSKSQLSNLKSDLKKQLISNTDSVAYYIAAEKKAVEMAQNSVDDIKYLFEKQKEAYELTHNKVDSLINIIKQNQQ